MHRSIALFVALLCARILADEAPHIVPYATADFGGSKFQDIRLDQEFPYPVVPTDLRDDLESTLDLSVAGGLTGSTGVFGLGVFYRTQWAGGSKSFTPRTESITLDRDEVSLRIHLFGVQSMLRIPIVEHLFVRTEFGLANALTSLRMQSELNYTASGNLMSVRSVTTTKYSGSAFLLAAGLDYMFNRQFGCGLKASFVNGSVSPKSSAEDSDFSSRMMSTDGFADLDISSYGLWAGIRLSR